MPQFGVTVQYSFGTVWAPSLKVSLIYIKVTVVEVNVLLGCK